VYFIAKNIKFLVKWCKNRINDVMHSSFICIVMALQSLVVAYSVTVAVAEHVSKCIDYTHSRSV